MRRASAAAALVGLVGLVGACGRVHFEDSSSSSTADARSVADGDASPAGPNYAAAVLASSPLAYYRLDEASGAAQARDSSGHGYDAPYVAVAGGTLSQGQAGALTGNAAISLSGLGNAGGGSAAYVDLANVVPSLLTTFTVEGWIEPQLPPTNYDNAFIVCELYLTSGFRTGWGGTMLPSIWTVQSGGTLGFDATTAMMPGAWSHLAFVTAGTTATIYLDGLPVGSGPLDISTSQPIQKFFIGASQGMASIGGFDEIALYDRALSQAELAAHVAARD